MAPLARRLLSGGAMTRRALALLALVVPAIAHAQVIVVNAPWPPPPPPIVVAPPGYPPPPPGYPPPPAYLPPPPLGAVPPHVYIRERIRWHLRRHFPLVAPMAPRVVVVAPPAVVVMPPAVVVERPVVAVQPPVVMPLPAVPPPIVAPAPPMVYFAPPSLPPPELEVVRPMKKPVQWASKVGLGVRGSGQVVDNGWNNLGIGGEFLYRASPHLVTELAAEYQKNPDGPLGRVDVPVTIGLRVHIGRPDWIVSPYFVFAAGIDVGMLDYKFTTDTSIYLDGQLGGGLELRLGKHFAITADARLDAKKRLNDVDAAVATTKSINGKAVHPLGDEYGGQFRLGAAVYF
jgi:hypothetical protein